MINLNFQSAIKYIVSLLIAGIIFTTFSCKQNTQEREREGMEQTGVDTTTVREVDPRAFTGEIRRVGDGDNDLSGEIAMRIEGDLMRFTVSAEGLAPDLMHMQYLLVSQTGDETQCPGSEEEVERMGESNGSTTTSGTTIRRIPLHMGPTTLNLESDTYPRTNANGELQFSRVVSLDSLRNAVRTEYNMQDLDFSKFTFVVRGIPGTQSSPDPIGNAPGAQNIPVGCAKLQETAVTD